MRGSLTIRLCTLCILMSVSAASGAYGLTFDFNLRFVEPVPVEGYYETWENKTLNVVCDWTVTITGGTASEFPLSPVRALLSVGPGEGLVKTGSSYAYFESYITAVAINPDAIPQGNYPAGTALAGTLKGQVKANEPNSAMVACALLNSYGAWYTYWHSSQDADRPVRRIVRPVHKPEPLDSLRLPTPIIQAPVSQPGGEVVIFPTDASLHLKASIVPFKVNWTLDYHAEQKDFVEMCQFTKVFVETWHMQILKREPTGMFIPVADFAAPVTSYERLVQLAPHYFDKYGTGVWRLKTWISQDNTPSGTILGAASVVDFELRAQAPTALIVPATLGALNRASAGSSRAADSDSKPSQPSVLATGRSTAPTVTAERPAQPAQPAGAKSTQRVALAAASGVIKTMERAAPGTKLFEAPLVDGKRVDLCLHWGSDCGQPAADAFCQKSGYSKAAEFKEAHDIGAQTPTLVLGDGKLCTEAYCDGFAMIRCTN